MKQINSQLDLIWMTCFAGQSYLIISSFVYIIFNLRSLYFQSLQSLLNWIRLHTSRTSAIYTPFQSINELFYRQNFASNVNLYSCERSRQNHLVGCLRQMTFRSRCTDLKDILLHMAKNQSKKSPCINYLQYL